MSDTATIPECLARTSVDDQREARRTTSLSHGPYECAKGHAGWFGAERHVCCGVGHDNGDDSPCWHLATDKERFDAALAAIQRREAGAVFALVQGMGMDRDRSHYERTAFYAAVAATWYGQTKYGQLTVAQRGTLLDAARSLARLALELAR